jgi:FtsZ-binding cell division protein ZapB
MANTNLACWAELWTKDLDRALKHRVDAGYIYDDPNCDVETQISIRFLPFEELDEVYLCEPLKYDVQASLLYRYDDKKTRGDNLAVLDRQIKKRYARIFEAWNGKHKKFQLVMVKKHPDHISTYDTGLDKVNTGNMSEIKQFKNQNFRLKHENYDLHVKVGSCQEKINEQHIAICDLEKELNTYKTLANLENQKRLFFELEELKQKNKVKEFKIQELQTENDRLKSKYNDLKTKHEAMFAEPPGGGSNSPTNYEEEDKRWNIPSQYHVDEKVQGKIYGAGFR